MNYQRYVLALLLCLTAGSNSQIGPPCRYMSQLLMNMAVYEGNSSSFFNQFDQNNVTWEIAPSSDSPNPHFYTVAEDNVLKSPFFYSYTINQTQLNIPKASIYPRGSDLHSTSGLYRVTYKTDHCQTMANLVVVSKEPVCQCKATDPNNAVLSCDLEYGVTRTQQNNATMTWYDEYGHRVNEPEIPVPDQSNLDYDVSTSYFLINSSDDASYTCRVTFTPPSREPYHEMADNAPNFTASCTVANCVKPSATTSAGHMNKESTQIASNR